MMQSFRLHCKRVFGSIYKRFTFFTQWIVMCTLGAWLIYGDPYGLGSASERAAERAVYRLLSGLYDASKSEQSILVVLFNDQSIANLYPYLWESNDWPLSYSDQASILTTLMSLEPRGVFYDVMWMKQRSLDGSYNRAIQHLKAMEQATQIPLWFARGTSDSNMTEGIEQDLKSFSSLAINGWEGEGDLYPLHSDNTPNTATMLYNFYCEQMDCQGIRDVNAPSMSVRWNANSAPILLPHRNQQCRDRGSAFQLLVQTIKSVAINIIPWLEEENQLQLCPPQRVLYVDELMAMVRSPNESERERVKSIVEGSIVLVGGQIEGVQDYVLSPVHGSLPGVFFHAMALDNLITFGQSYTREDDSVDHVNFVIWMLYMTLLISIRRYASNYMFLRWLNERQWLLSGVFIVGILSLVFGVFHFAPSSWISILALGWVSIQIIERVESYHIESKNES